jgi:hypothetical protein
MGRIIRVGMNDRVDECTPVLILQIGLYKQVRGVGCGYTNFAAD